MDIIKDRLGNVPYFVANDKKTEKQPVLIYLHGAGGRNLDYDEAAESNYVLRYAKACGNLPFKIYAPQCHADTWFDVYEQLCKLIDHIADAEKNSEIYLAGVSMGGYCSWQLLMSRPMIFRKAIICCGGGMYWNAGRIKASVRAFHGGLDETVYPEESCKMVKAVKARGGDAELTVYDDLGHNVWERVFTQEENYRWLLE